MSTATPHQWQRRTTDQPAPTSPSATHGGRRAGDRRRAGSAGGAVDDTHLRVSASGQNVPLTSTDLMMALEGGGRRAQPDPCADNMPPADAPDLLVAEWQFDGSGQPQMVRARLFSLGARTESEGGA